MADDWPEAQNTQEAESGQSTLPAEGSAAAFGTSRALVFDVAESEEDTEAQVPDAPAAEAPVEAEAGEESGVDLVRRVSGEIERSLLESGMDGGVEVAAAVRRVVEAPVVVAVAGPTKSGKSTLVNALFGRLVVPSGALPNTLVPIAFTGGGRERHKLEVCLVGQGLAELLERCGAVPEADGRPLPVQQAYVAVERVNSQLRRFLERVEDYGAFLGLYPHLAGWHLQIRTVTERHFTLVDLPGGSESGPAGHAIQSFLRCQVERSTLLLFVAMASNVAPLSHGQQVRSFLGGAVPRRPAMVLLNAIEKEEVRSGAQSFLEGNRQLKEALSNLDVLDTFYVSARVTLAARLLEHLQGELGAAVVPGLGDAAYDHFELELRAMYEAIYPAGHFDEDYDDDRDRLPRKIRQAFERPFADNARFQARFEHYLLDSWPRTLCRIISTQALSATRDRLTILEAEALEASRTSEEAVAEQARYQALLQPERIDVLRQHVLYALAGSPRAEEARRRFDAACELLGTRRPKEDLSFETLAATTDSSVAASWQLNVHQFDGLRAEFRCYFPKRARAEAFAAAFRDWCAGEACEAASGAAALETVRRWLSRELGRELDCALGLELAVARGAAAPALGEPQLPRGIGAALLERVFVAPFILVPAVVVAPVDKGASIRLAAAAAAGHEAFRMNGDLRALWPRLAREVLDKALEARSALAARAAQDSLGRAVVRAARRAEGGDTDRRRALEAAECARIAVRRLEAIPGAHQP